MDYDPAQLPPIDEVHILVLGTSFDSDKPQAKEVLDVGWRYPIHATTRVVEPRAVQVVAQTWRALSGGQQARCHIPPYGVRFFNNGQMLLEGSICWRCNNMFLWVADETTGYSFESESEAAQRLLRLAQYLSGDLLRHSPGAFLTLDDVL